MEQLLVVSIVCLAIGAIALVLVGATYASVRRVLRRRVPQGGVLPPVSVLKPLAGIDIDLYANLVSLARQEYPCFELVIGAENPADPALEMAWRLRREFPRVPITIVAGTAQFGANPKVQNLATLARHARYGCLLISDANVHAAPNYLAQLASELDDPQVGIVTNVLTGGPAESVGGTFESLLLNSFVAGSVCGAEVLARHAVVVGKSMLFRREHLEKVGGFAAVKDVLAEDYVLGRRFQQAGLRVVLSPQVLVTTHRRRSLHDFCGRHHRWHQMRRWVSVWSYLGEPLLNPIAWLTLGVVLALMAGEPRLTPWLARLGAVAIVCKCCLDLWLARVLKARLPRVIDLPWIPIKDALVAVLWVIGLFDRRVVWRGHVMRIGRGTMLASQHGRLATKPASLRTKEAA